MPTADLCALEVPALKLLFNSTDTPGSLLIILVKDTHLTLSEMHSHVHSSARLC